MADTRLRLRGIIVSTRAALVSLPSEADSIRDRSLALIDELEADVLANGADPGVLRDIELFRQEVAHTARRSGSTDGGRIH